MTPLGAPETITKSLVDDINRLNVIGEAVSPFQIASLKREIKTLTKADLPVGYVLKGMVAGLEEDIEEMRHNHENAIKLRENVFSCSNYGVSLFQLGFYKDALDNFENAYQFDQSSVESLVSIIETNIIIGKFDDANAWMKKLKKLNSDTLQEIEPTIENSIEFLKTHNLSFETYGKIIDLAIGVLHENGVYRCETMPSVDTDDESSWLNWVIRIRLPVKDVIELAGKFTDKLLESTEILDPLGHINLRYESVLR